MVALEILRRNSMYSNPRAILFDSLAPKLVLGIGRYSSGTFGRKTPNKTLPDSPDTPGTFPG